MRKKILAFLLVIAVVFALSTYLSAHSVHDFRVEICDSYYRLYAENNSGEEVDSYTIRVKIYDDNGDLLETETYSGDHFTSLSIPLEQPEGYGFAFAVMTVRLIDGTVYRFDSWLE